MNILKDMDVEVVMSVEEISKYRFDRFKVQPTFEDWKDPYLYHLPAIILVYLLSLDSTLTLRLYMFTSGIFSVIQSYETIKLYKWYISKEAKLQLELRSRYKLRENFVLEIDEHGYIKSFMFPYDIKILISISIIILIMNVIGFFI